MDDLSFIFSIVIKILNIYVIFKKRFKRIFKKQKELWSMGKFRAPALTPGKTQLRSAPAPGPCFLWIKSLSTLFLLSHIVHSFPPSLAVSGHHDQTAEVSNHGSYGAFSSDCYPWEPSTITQINNAVSDYSTAGMNFDEHSQYDVRTKIWLKPYYI